jgi:hypothetical protein
VSPVDREQRPIHSLRKWACLTAPSDSQNGGTVVWLAFSMGRQPGVRGFGQHSGYPISSAENFSSYCSTAKTRLKLLRRRLVSDGKRMAGTTGLEPATSDVTGRRSNQLSYVPAMSLDNQIVTRSARAFNRLRGAVFCRNAFPLASPPRRSRVNHLLRHAAPINRRRQDLYR